MKKILFIPLAALFMACGSHKNIQKDTTIATPAITTPAKPAPVVAKQKNVVAKLDLTIIDKSKNSDMTVDGKLQMRSDEVIRLLITPYGIMEAGRLEFTPNYVLLVDRINKQFVKAKYDEVDFLRKNNIDFATIQKHFWEEYKKENLTLDIDKMTLKIRVKSISNNSNFEATTTLPSKYKQVSVEEVMKQLGGM